METSRKSQPVAFGSEAEAARAGLGLVHQPITTNICIQLATAAAKKQLGQNSVTASGFFTTTMQQQQGLHLLSLLLDLCKHRHGLASLIVERAWTPKSLDSNKVERLAAAAAAAVYFQINSDRQRRARLFTLANTRARA